MIFCPLCGNLDSKTIKTDKVANMVIYTCKKCGKSFDDLMLKEAIKKINDCPECKGWKP